MIPGPTLWVVRHGESTWNAAGRMQRQTPHPPLTAAGLTQAHTAGDTLRDKQINRIVTSDAVRATQTAQVMAAVLEVPVSTDVRLRERGWAAPGVLEDPTERVRAVLSEIAGSGDRVAVITHGDIVYLIRDLLCAAWPWESGSDVPNGAVLELRVNALSGQ